jgi:hypothetical protein
MRVVYEDFVEEKGFTVGLVVKHVNLRGSENNFSS